MQINKSTLKYQNTDSGLQLKNKNNVKSLQRMCFHNNKTAISDPTD